MSPTITNEVHASCPAAALVYDLEKRVPRALGLSGLAYKPNRKRDSTTVRRGPHNISSRARKRTVRHATHQEQRSCEH